MTADSLQKQIQAPDDHLFRKDRSGNPAGRRPGSRNRATLAAEVLLEGEAEAFHRHGKSIVPLPGDRKLLAAIVQKFQSGPVGVAALAAVLSEEVETIEDVYEPYLLQLGFLDRTPQGRVATESAREHLRSLGYEIPTPRRAERTDSGLWDGITSEGRTESETIA